MSSLYCTLSPPSTHRVEQEIVVLRVLVVDLETLVPEERMEKLDLMVSQDDPEALDPLD